MRAMNSTGELERRQGASLEADRAVRALRRHYPALCRALGPWDVERLGRELVRCHPFAHGSGLDFALLWPDFLAFCLEDDSRQGTWLCELARYEESLAWAERQDADAPPLRCEYRIDEVHGELLAGGEWHAPRPAEVLFVFERGRWGSRAVLSRELGHLGPATSASRSP